MREFAKLRLAARPSRPRSPSSSVLDGTGQCTLDTGLPFLEHMLDQIARHGQIDLNIHAKGDLHIDAHHTVEDIGITTGSGL